MRLFHDRGVRGSVRYWLTQLEPTMEVATQKKPRKSEWVKDNFMLPPEIRTPLAQLSEKTGASKGELVRRALRRYLAEELPETV
jgi:hypothetical protein